MNIFIYITACSKKYLIDQTVPNFSPTFEMSKEMVILLACGQFMFCAFLDERYF